MFQKEKMESLLEHFQRIFTLPITRTTFRELQNAVITASDGDGKKATTFIESLLANSTEGVKDGSLKEFIKMFAIPARVAKQVQDNGDVLSMLTSDVGIQGDNILFSVRIRRIDGGEFHFITETDGVLQVTEHLLSRLNEAKQSATGKGIISNYKPRLEKVKALLNQIAKE